jgi:hypothetical protein
MQNVRSKLDTIEHSVDFSNKVSNITYSFLNTYFF